MRALLLHHPYTYPRFEQDFVDRIGALPEFDVLPADLDALGAGVLTGVGRSIRLTDYDAVIVFVAFKRLRAAPALSWNGFERLRVLMDHDIIQNYSDIFDPTLKGAWPPVFRRHSFDAVVTSGAGVRDRLRDEGIDAYWVPKGFEQTRFNDLGGAREGVVTFGSAYRCRQIAERAVTDANLPLARLPMIPYFELGVQLDRFLACMAISADIEFPIERGDLQQMTARDVPMRPGLEPMAKLFEAAGAGCCPIADAMDDLHALGFRDGETALTFRTYGELVDKLQAALCSPGDLRTIGVAAAKLAHAEHTWAHRAARLREILLRRV